MNGGRIFFKYAVMRIDTLFSYRPYLQVDAVMKKFDTNKDGKLDFEEFRKMLNSKKKDKQFIFSKTFLYYNYNH